MRLEVNIQMQGVEELEAALAKLSHKAQNLAPVFHDFGNTLTQGIEESFDGQRSYDGTSWEALKPSTLAYKQKHGGSKILQSGESNLYESIAYNAESNSLTVGVNAYSDDGYPYPLVHQFGTTKAGRAKNTTIPERPFMPIDEDGNVYEEVKEELLELLEEYLSEF